MMDLGLLLGNFEYIEGTNNSLDILRIEWRETLVTNKVCPASMKLLKLRSVEGKLYIFNQSMDDAGNYFEMYFGKTSKIISIKIVEYTSLSGFYFDKALEVKTANSTYYFYIA